MVHTRISTRILGGWFAVSLALLGACSGDDVPDKGGAADAVTDASAGGSDALTADVADTAGGVDAAAADGDAAEVGELCPGGVGCPCTGNADCDTAFCLETAAGRRCAATCVQSCPDGLACVPAPGSADVVFVCVDRAARLCLPCSENKDCQATGLTDARCLDRGDAGRFCGIGCDADSDCPADFECADAADEGGAVSKQCVPKPAAGGGPGVCPCNDNAVALAAKTPCQKALDDVATCKGEARCLTAGAAAVCEADDPAAEQCDGLDNDCDGATDEQTCDDANACTTDACGGTAGCSHTKLADQSPCDADGSACTVGDGCLDGSCVAGVAISCDDANACTQDACDLAAGCTHVDLQGAACDDGSACTSGETCKGAACQGGKALDCEDGSPCTLDGCNPKSGCTQSVAPDQTPCQSGSLPDGAAWCQSGVCAPKPGLGTACKAGGECASGFCVDGVCCDGACNGGCEACAAKLTGSKDGTCAPVTAGTDPADACATDDVATCGQTGACDGKGGCANYPLGTVCAAPGCDGAAVVAESVCTPTGCVAGTKTACTTDKPCYESVCQAATCVVQPSTAPCDDGDLCTKDDACAEGSCKGKPGACDDAEPCTIDTCDAQNGCSHQPLADETLCTADEQKWCQSGKCVLRIAGYDCADVLRRNPQAKSGTYLVDPDDQGPNKPLMVLCDMTTDGGGWTLMSLFSQHKSITNLDQARYEKNFAQSPIWIEGGAEGVPLVLESGWDDYAFLSHDWRVLLNDDGAYQLRQEAKTALGQAFDVAYRFRYRGRVLQDGADPKAPAGDERVWPLADRKVLVDASGVTWDVADGPARFWLPFTVAAAGKPVVTACFGALDGPPCEGDTQTVLQVTRRFGDAGIIGAAGDSKDPALSWAPNTNGSKQALDIAFQHQSQGVFNSSGGKMVLRYWTRSLCGNKTIEDGEQCDDGNRDAGDGCGSTCRVEPAASCAAIRAQFPTAQDGLYPVDPDGPGPIAAADVFCDMSGGGWTLVANLVDGAGDDLPGDVAAQAKGWRQTGNGTFVAGGDRVDRLPPATGDLSGGLPKGTGAAAVGPAFVAALAKAGSGELRVCLVEAPAALGPDVADAASAAAGAELRCRSSFDGSLTLGASDPGAKGNATLAAWKADPLAFTYARLAGMAGSSASSDPATLTTGAFPIAVAPGAANGFGTAGSLAEQDSTSGCFGAWAGKGDGLALRPGETDDNELGGCAKGGGGKLPNPGTAVGVRLWIGPAATLGSKAKPAASCKAIRDAGASLGNGRYWLDPDGKGPPLLAQCEMRVDGGGWTQVVRIDKSSAAHGDVTTAVGEPSSFVAGFKLADATIDALTTGGKWRYRCGASYAAFVTNAGKSWSSKKANGLAWSLDRDRDGVFECQATDGGGYGFTEQVACASGWTRYVAKGGIFEGGGCYVSGAGWGQAGAVWTR
ncbi:MAG: hypothetical protein RIT45_2980 [Pseudomonadota bacterium]